MQLLCEEFRRVQQDTQKETQSQAGARTAAAAIAAAEALCDYSRRYGWINIEDAFELEQITGAPLFTELKYIADCFLYECGNNGKIPDDVWPYYFSGAYSGLSAFIYLYYIYAMTLIKDEINTRLLKSFSIFLMPDSVRGLFPDDIEEMKLSQAEYEIERVQRKRETENQDFNEVIADRLDPARVADSEYALLDFITLNLSEPDLNTFAAAHNDKPSVMGLLDVMGGAAAKRLYDALPKDLAAALESKYREYPYSPRRMEAAESAELLLKLTDEGKITLPGAAADFIAATKPPYANNLDNANLKDLFFRTEHGGIVTLAYAAPYALANSSLFEDKKAWRLVEKLLPYHVYEYIEGKRENHLDYTDMIDNDAILKQKIIALAENGRIRLDRWRHYRDE